MDIEDWIEERIRSRWIERKMNDVFVLACVCIRHAHKLKIYVTVGRNKWVTLHYQHTIYIINKKFSVISTLTKDNCSAFFKEKKMFFVFLSKYWCLTVRLSTISSRSQTHPSHSQTSRLLSSYLLGLPFTRSTQCVRVSVTVLLFVREEEVFMMKW
jgi:hypothetical protein